MIDVLVHEHVSGGGLAGRELPESWAVEGSAIRRALARDFAAVPGVRVRMTLDCRLPDEPGPWTVVRPGPDSLPKLAARSNYTAPIAPETDGVLRDLVVSLTKAGARSIGCSPQAIDLAGDKLRLADHLARSDIRCPSSRRVQPRNGLPADATYPAVLKPVDGAGSVDTYFIEGPDDPTVDRFTPEIGLLQPFIPGEPMSATFLIGRDGTAQLVGVGRQDIRRIGPQIAYRGGTILAESLPLNHPTRRAVGCVPGLMGLVGVDFIHDRATGRATVIEINPRPTTSCVGLVAAIGPGRLAAAWLATATSVDSLTEDLTLRFAPISFRADGTIA